MENNTFKGSLFGGFNREDVIDYIKKTSAESTAPAASSASEAAASSVPDIALMRVRLKV